MRYLSAVFCFIYLSGYSQGDPSRFALDPLGKGQQHLAKRSTQLHSNLQPFVKSLDTTWIQASDSSTINRIEIRPSGAIAAGYSLSDSSRATWQASPGVLLNANLGTRWDLGAAYHFITEKYPTYLQAIADSLSIMPGIGFATSDKNGSIAHYYEGHIGYQAGKHFHFEVGRGKHFWGDGYRSLLLSQNTAPYPYFRLDTRVWNLKFVNLIGQFRDRVPGVPFSDTRHKYGALHSLSWNISKRVNISFYEMVIWQEKDSLSDRGLDLNYMHPLLFLRPVEYAQGSADNVMLGFSFSIKSNTNQLVYGSIIIDEFLLDEVYNGEGWWANKFGGQIGVKSFDTFTEGLHFQLEINAVRPFTYTHGSRLQSYGNQNQGLAHSFNTNFRELMLLARYEMKDWTFLVSASAAEYGRDRVDENYGGDLFRSYVNPFNKYGNTVGQGEHHVYWMQRVEVSRELKSGLQAFADIMIRSEYVDGKAFPDHFFQAGVRMPMLRNYRDF